ncbi:PREDICTED: ubiquitin carboxyl-terminal hydrolase 10-like isoform X2 [Amphimedon queenslandica]|uniref:ubiquitinyl hydrolase 1 n=1 Tax=Amphimedon queenslandica TaxID=400682 RepID=A0A1X7VQV6_AMPQE|nr:PREDICTED: ubiquitin carboxyl-terminal hydrolase 10-like isoform X2 [Amphimedon queenslandica]|eukprot:XP_011407917.1 PREDICTED: ubiquitin carboxyl-terminal hydrolase 10-like isoform X2 [Amphimedon queenslandica]
MADTGAVEEFIAKSKNLAPVQSQESTSEDWESLAPGVDPTDYQPKDTPIIPPPPPPPPVDSGRVPNLLSVSGKKDIEDLLAEPGVCGLINLGNTCYMNSGLQSLRSIPQLTQFYLNNVHPVASTPTKKEGEAVVEEEEEKERLERERGPEDQKDGEGEKDEDKTGKKDKSKDIKTLTQGHISARFSALIQKTWAGQFSAIVPQSFKTTLGLRYPQFSGYRQQDCQEFLVLLLDCLHEDIINQFPLKSCMEKRDGSDNEGQVEETRSVITSTFQGQLKNEVTCSVCGHVSVKCDPFVYLSVPIPHSNEQQITIFWSSVTGSSRSIEKLLVIIPILSTVNDLKTSLCQLLEEGEGERGEEEDGGGGVSIVPDSVILAHVKEHSIVSTLGNALSIKHVIKDEYKVYAFQVGSPPSTKAIPEVTATPQRDGYERITDDEVPMETDSSPRQPASEDGLPFKIPRSDEADEATPLLEEAEPTVVVMEWHSCVICLEEMVDSELLTHSVCGAMICDTCLQASRNHSGTENGLMPCPVCKSMVTLEEGFVPLAAPDKSDDIVRLLQLTVLFRNKVDDTWVLFGHPCLLNVPASASIDKYYQLISPLLPEQCRQYPWSLALTDGKGRYCSRCLFGSGCGGCVLTNAMTDVNLKPGDFFSISFTNLPSTVVQEADSFRSHSSLDSLWPSSVSLQDCLDLFSQKETLGQDNPWFCSKCNMNQTAVRQLLISQLPTTLIVHLKRFLFHGNTASKVETGVNFPLSLSLSSSSSSAPTDYSLVSCVCHFGTLNSGHYTNYSKQPVSHKWYYYNDETVSEITPSDKDNESAYILFYHRQDSNTFDFPSKKDITFPTQEEELVELEPLLRALKPKPPPAPLPPPLPPIKKSSSTGNLAADTSDNDIQLQQQIAASLGLDIPAMSTPGPSPLKPSSSNPTLPAEQFSEPVVFKSAHFKSFDAS